MKKSYRTSRNRTRINKNPFLKSASRTKYSNRAVQIVAKKIKKSPLIRNENLAKLEAILFVSSEPLSVKRLVTLCGFADSMEARENINKLREHYHQDESPFQIDDIAGGYQLRLRPNYYSWLHPLQKMDNSDGLSRAALETLTIIAYRQPLMRAEIEKIRGVQIGEILSQLVASGWVKTVGRDSSLGRPILYGTTKRFLQKLGLERIEDLPNWDELQR